VAWKELRLIVAERWSLLAREGKTDGEASFRAVAGPEFPVVQAHGAVRDGEADTKASGVLLARGVYAIEGAKDIFQFRLRDAWSKVSHIERDHA
jgi:hypothetical protein